MTVIERIRRHPLLVALCIGLGIAIGERILFNHALGRPLEIDEPVAILMRGLLTAAPFRNLSLRGKQYVLPWFVGVASSGWRSWWLLQKAIAYQRNPDGSGVDTGAVVFVMLAICHNGSVPMAESTTKPRSRERQLAPALAVLWSGSGNWSLAGRQRNRSPTAGGSLARPR